MKGSATRLCYIGCPVANRAWVLQDWIDAVRQLEQPDDMKLEYRLVALLTESHDRTYNILVNNKVQIVELPFCKSRSDQEINNHWWSDTMYTYMASLRNKLVTYVQEQNADYFFSLDSDIITRPDTVRVLIDALHKFSGDAIAPKVNMDKNPDVHAWNTMAFSEHSPTHAFRPEYQPKADIYPVDIIMAAMLMNKKALDLRWDWHSQGEDLAWSLAANTAKIRLLWHSAHQLEHRMNPQ